MAISDPATHKPQQPQPKAISSSFYKAILVLLLAALLPFFPSQAPEFINQSILSRGWELIHLLFIGIAISYGLFSSRNSDPDNPDKDVHQKPADTPHSYVSRLLHVSSVFDDDDDQPPSTTDGNIQTWNSQYHRSNDPVVVVGNGDTTTTTTLLRLPVRNLKAVEDIDGDTTMDQTGSLVSTLDEAKESVVLPSPIPWRSRSGRMEVKDEVIAATVAAPLPPKIPSVRPAVPRPVPATPSPEMGTMTGEDSVKKKRFYKSTPPPPPPPPPPPLVHGLLHVNDRREAKMSFKDELKNHTKPRNNIVVPPVASRSVRTVRWKEAPDVAELPEEEPSLSPRSREKKGEIAEEVIVASDGDSDSDSGEESSEAENSPSSVMPNEYEVDKKADEFIAKFREQIRLQRIESIKRSSRHPSLRKP